MTILARISPGYNITRWNPYNSMNDLKRATITALDPSIQVPHSYIVNNTAYRVGIRPDEAGGGIYEWEVNEFTYGQFAKAFSEVRNINLPKLTNSVQMDEVLFVEFRKIFHLENYNYTKFMFQPYEGAEYIPVYI